MHFEITGDVCNLIGSHWYNLSRIASFFALNRIFFPANEEALLIQQPIASLKKPIKLQENEKQLLQLSTN